MVSPTVAKNVSRTLEASLTEIAKQHPSFPHTGRKLNSSLKPRFSMCDDVMEYIDGIQVVHCDPKGGQYEFKPHEVILSIPEGATESSAYVDIGVALQGPLVFPRDTKPLSPVVMLYMSIASSLSKAVELRIPHCFRATVSDSHLLAIFKASQPKKQGGKLIFQKIDRGEFNILPGGAVVRVKLSQSVPLFFCVGCKMTREVTAKINYCVLKVVPKSTKDITWHLFLCVSYYLNPQSKYPQIPSSSPIHGLG